MLAGMVRTDTAWISQQMGEGLEIHTLYQSRRCDLYFPYYSSSFSVYIDNCLLLYQIIYCSVLIVFIGYYVEQYWCLCPRTLHSRLVKSLCAVRTVYGGHCLE